MIKSTTYATAEEGPHFLVLGAVHGNEKCGTVAIRRVIAEIDDGSVILVRGKVTFVPVTNPRAYLEDKRFIERNLNRYLVPMVKPDTYEARLGNALCPLLESCDVLLDIHSYSVGGPAFVFVGKEDRRGHAFAANLGDVALMTGWQEAYAASGRKKAETSPDEATGTTEYSRRHGAISVTLECGQHRDPNAPQIGYEAIRNALRYLNLTDEPKAEARPISDARVVTVKEVFYRDDAGEFCKDWKHMTPVSKDEAVALRADGSAIRAPADGCIVLPDAQSPIGAEWFYFATENKAPESADVALATGKSTVTG
ncbi:MAG: succinylglutamate desuccinylase/aspartoacylase family protein [Pseudomonadota bacterium]|nr:succinylglutamate desuccinylase/aspartoacylase family protein [Pseudomonadota bacterium]